MGSRCLRLQHARLHPDRHPEELYGGRRACGTAGEDDADHAALGRSCCWIARRQIRAEVAVDVVGVVVLALCVPQWLFYVVYDALRVACAVRLRHGRRMVRRHAAGPRALAVAIPRDRIGVAARRLELGLPVRGGGVSVYLSALQPHAGYRLESYVLDCHRPRAAHALDSVTSVRESGMAGAA